MCDGVYTCVFFVWMIVCMCVCWFVSNHVIRLAFGPVYVSTEVLDAHICVCVVGVYVYVGG